jgi:hypothetical protein
MHVHFEFVFVLMFMLHEYENAYGHGHGPGGRHGRGQGHEYWPQTLKDSYVGCKISVKSLILISNIALANFSPIPEVTISSVV